MASKPEKHTEPQAPEATAKVMDFVYTEQSETFSTWHNTTTDTARFRLMQHEKRNGKKGNGQGNVFLDVVIPPGKSIKLKSEFDRAIRHVKDGFVIGGLCPWLTKVGEENVVVNKSLDYQQAWIDYEVQETVVKLEEEEKLAKALELVKQKRNKG